MQNNIQKLLQERYYLPNENTWEELATRVSDIYPPIKEYIINKDFIPSTPTLMNANTKGQKKGTLSSCFTMGIEDSIEGIFESIKEAAIVTKASGGVGYDFSNLRSSHEGIKTLQDRPSSGPLPFALIFNQTLDGIQQGGVRRGAGMGLLRVNHPNILDFIRIKNNKGVMERLNLSVKMTNEFYKKLDEDPNSIHQVVYKDGTTHDLLDNGKSVTVKQLWDEIIEHAWLCAEPGIINEDIAKDQCTVFYKYLNILTNPCSEFVNPEYSSCNLGSINLVNFVQDGVFDWERFKATIKISTRFLNNIIDINEFPLQKIKETTQNIRPIGLGMMGLAHAFYLMSIPFNSIEADMMLHTLTRNLTCVSMYESVQIAKETGIVYPDYNYDEYVRANQRFFEEEFMFDDYTVSQFLSDLKLYGITNSCNSSIAPTGSISYLANVSSGIEPSFALTYARKIEKLNKEYEVVYISDPIFDRYLDENFDEKTKTKILKQVADNKGSCQKVVEIPEDIKKVFVIASDITPLEHLKSLGIVARSTSLSVSKTVNLPSDATKEEISDLYIKAYKEGVIGVTVYRDGCREGILVHQTDSNDEETIARTNAPKRPKSLPCHVYKMNILNRATSEAEKWIVFVGLLKGEPYEIIAGKIDDIDIPSSITEGEMIKTKKNGKKVYQFSYNGEVLISDVCGTFLNDIREYSTRLMSLALRHGAGIEHLQTVLRKSGTIVDFNQAIVRAISKYVKETASKEKCPTCNDELIYVEGCIKCKNPECSYTKCG